MYSRGHGGRDLDGSNEAQPLLQPLSRTATVRACCHQQHQLLCVRSKPAFLVIIWKLFVAAVLGPNVTAYILAYLKHGGLRDLPRFAVIALISYASQALLTLFYPFGGFVADVCVGRFKLLLTSLWLTWIASLATSVGIAVLYYYYITWNTKPTGGVEISFVVVGVVLYVGLAGFEANVVQFGTDQLLEAQLFSWSF